jgi:hypothetical protein
VSSTSSRIGSAIAAIAMGAATGGVIICGFLIGAYGMPRGAQTPFANLVLVGAAAGLVVAALTGFWAARNLGAWRALLVAIISVSGAALFTALTTVADIAAGRPGLLALAILCAVVIAVAARFRPAPQPAS